SRAPRILARQTARLEPAARSRARRTVEARRVECSHRGARFARLRGARRDADHAKHGGARASSTGAFPPSESVGAAMKLVDIVDPAERSRFGTPDGEGDARLRRLVDIGSNLSNKAFRGDLDDVLTRAHAHGVTTIIATGTSVTGSYAVRDIAAAHAREGRPEI